MTTKSIALPKFLTEAQIARASKLYETHGMWDSVAKIETEVIAPNLAAINRKLGQENDPRYLAYAVVYVLSQLGGARAKSEQ